MMKNALLLLLFFPMIASAQSEQYYVTFLKGVVFLQKTKQPLKPGDKLSADDKLIFRDKNCKLNCISPGKGRFEISAEQTKPNNDGELYAVLKSNLLPIANTYHLSTRSLMFEGYEPKTYFKSDETQDRILLLTDKALPIVSSYKIESGNIFFVQYQLNGKTITKKIEYSDKGLLFKAELFDDGIGTNRSEKVMLCYQSKETGTPKSIILAEFIPVFETTANIKEQIALVSKYTEKSDKKIRSAEIASHIFQNYGKIGLEELATLEQ
jgi:hypothetical protein